MEILRGKILELIKIEKNMSSPFFDFDTYESVERKFVEISEREQRRIGQDLHDSLGQILTGIAFISKVLEKKLADKSAVEANQAATITKLVSEAITSTQSLVRTLNPVQLEKDGFLLALEELVEKTERTFDISCYIKFDKPVLIFDNFIATHLYRIIQEAINNTIRHGNAKNINIEIKHSDQRLIIMIRDDGVGFTSVLKNKKCMGLNIMKCRAEMIGASLSIRKDTNGGTIVKCSLKQDPKDKAKKLYEARK